MGSHNVHGLHSLGARSLDRSVAAALPEKMMICLLLAKGTREKKERLSKYWTDRIEIVSELLHTFSNYLLDDKETICAAATAHIHIE